MSQQAIVGDRTRPSRPVPSVEKPLRGPWLFIARLCWIALTLLILALNALAIPNADALLQSVCQPGAHCVGGQLAPADLRQLQHIGLSPAFLAAYQLAWDVVTLLVDTLLAALIFWRRSQERMALFCAYVLVLTGGATYTSILDYGLKPLAPAWIWPVGVLEVLGLSSLLIFFLLFPHGGFAPRWTRWLVPLIIIAEVHYVFFNDLTQGPNGSADVFPVDFIVLAILVFILVGAQIYRYRRVSTHRERQQTKWVVFGFAGAMLGFVVSFTLEHLFFSDQTVQSPVFDTLVTTTVSFGFLLLIPISIAIAVLRSRLYDIDILINRTLVYGSLTTVLVVIYLVGVVGTQTLVQQVSGQKSGSSPVMVVVTTLLIAALFQPLRRHLQSAVDRRFYRRKYNVERTVSAFSATLRQEVDLDELSEQLLRVVQQTMEPDTLSLWLRSPTSHR